MLRRGMRSRAARDAINVRLQRRSTLRPRMCQTRRSGQVRRQRQARRQGGTTRVSIAISRTTSWRARRTFASDATARSRHFSRAPFLRMLTARAAMRRTRRRTAPRHARPAMPMFMFRTTLTTIAPYAMRRTKATSRLKRRLVRAVTRRSRSRISGRTRRAWPAHVAMSIMTSDLLRSLRSARIVTRARRRARRTTRGMPPARPAMEIRRMRRSRPPRAEHATRSSKHRRHKVIRNAPAATMPTAARDSRPRPARRAIRAKRRACMPR